jgi:pyruvate formate lyase activating enzyme
MRDRKIWVEVTTLVIPGQNDSPEELRNIADFIRGVGVEVPWHISLFHPDYRFTDVGATPLSKLDEACEIGRQAGLRYVYRGNIAGEENTVCFNCGETVLRRRGFAVTENRLQNGRCPRCSIAMDGVFSLT